MIIKNGTVFCEDGKFRNYDIRVENGVIAELGAALAADGAEKLDAVGDYMIPGMIDMHFHGCMGHDFCDGTPEALDAIARYEASIGVTSICPATMTYPPEKLCAVLQTAADYRAAQERGACGEDRAELVGVNMEGPFISIEKKGAQAAEHIIPCNTAVAEQFLAASHGLVKVIGVAPEMGDCVPFIREMSQKTVISIAHSNADYDTAKAAFDAGASHAVHLYNAMPEFTHRQPGIVGAAAENEKVTAELICDGIHIHPSVVRATFKLFGTERMILISDSMRAAGLSDGRYLLGGQEVDVCGSRAALVSDGSLAGSVTTLPDCVRTAVTKMGIPLEAALTASTANPAKRLSIYDKCGSLSVGKRADIVIWDKSYALKQVVLNGEMI